MASTGFEVALGGLMNVVLTQHIGAYQGDWLGVVVEENECWETARGGFLVNSFGSCSFCDEWMAAKTVEDRLAIVTRLVGSIRWFAKPSDMLRWLRSDAPELQWYSHEPQWDDFIVKIDRAAHAADEWIDFVWNLPVKVQQ